MNLDAYRRARLAAAQAAATALTADNEAEAADSEHAARQAAARRIEDARLDGVAAADREMALRGGRERRIARGTVLAARHQAYEALRTEVLASLPGLRTDPRYPALVAMLELLAREQLGEDARIDRDPEDAGGLVAEAEGRRVDYTLRSLADRCLRRLGTEVDRLWQ